MLELSIESCSKELPTSPWKVGWLAAAARWDGYATEAGRGTLWEAEFAWLSTRVEPVPDEDACGTVSKSGLAAVGVTLNALNLGGISTFCRRSCSSPELAIVVVSPTEGIVGETDFLFVLAALNESSGLFPEESGSADVFERAIECDDC
jgi:hypothetical protein